MECPFCGFRTTTEYQITLHVEQLHIADSPFAAKDEESLALALALQREEEDATTAISRDSETSRPLALSSNCASSTAGKHAYDGEDDFPYAECPYEDCDEFIHLSAYNEHLDLHASSNPSLEGDSINTITKMMNGKQRPIIPGLSLISQANQDSTSDHPARARENLSPLRKVSSNESKISRTVAPYLDTSTRKKRFREKGGEKRQPTRLGVGELGPYAKEEKMPSWLIDQLKRGGPVSYVNRISTDGKLVKEAIVENEVSGTVPVLARLCGLSDTVVTAYFCHPCVQHIFKRKNEGGFCGYRNIQMLLSFIIGTKSKSHERFGDRVPGVLDIQDMIEDAWDKGFGALGRVELGGVRNTRKWIGTPEALAVFSYLGMKLSCYSFSDSADEDEARAYERLFDVVETYFISGSSDTHDKTQKTHLPPIYLQRPSHSLTIVGFERHKNGDRNLLVFDPAFGQSRGVKQLLKDPLGHHPTKADSKSLLRSYRRGRERLEMFDGFEILVPFSTEPTAPI